jgi:hypothetical protein
VWLTGGSALGGKPGIVLGLRPDALIGVLAAFAPDRGPLVSDSGILIVETNYTPCRGNIKKIFTRLSKFSTQLSKRHNQAHWETSQPSRENVSAKLWNISPEFSGAKHCSTFKRWETLQPSRRNVSPEFLCCRRRIFFSIPTTGARRHLTSQLLALGISQTLQRFAKTFGHFTEKIKNSSRQSKRM